MAAQDRRGRCGCCGFLFSFLLFLLVLLLVGIGWFYWSAANQLDRLSSTAPVTLPLTSADRQIYRQARQKAEHFFSDSGERSMTLSSEELNALIAESPEMRILNRGTVVTLNQNSAELYCSLPVNLPFLSRRFFNYTIYVQPSMRGENIELEVFRMEREGKPLGPNGLRQFQTVAAPLLERILSTWNKLQFDRSVHDVRIENGSLILAR
jgi:hypothetical protein